MQPKLSLHALAVLSAFIAAAAAQTTVTVSSGNPSFTTTLVPTGNGSSTANITEPRPVASWIVGTASDSESHMPAGAIARAAVAASLGTLLFLGALAAAFVLARRRRRRLRATAAAAIPDACAAAIRAEQRYLALEDELLALRAEVASLAARPASAPLHGHGHEKDAEAMLESKDKLKEAAKDGPPTYTT
ncbi:hypothetical protein GGX14DRAFT_576682 [Mycena pura]|uniref:Uncharacterized protein n=1 Tax=Mycena pura TaxID=153505 RepID=A0AAD6UWW9_9AGAR|nr:hypothetical protein GGX14DRAFT_576682 [Mycena pura]